MSKTEKTIESLSTAKFILCNQQMLTPEMCIKIGQAVTDAIALLKEQTKIIYCKDCKSYDEQISICDNCGLPREQTFFCKDGKRR